MLLRAASRQCALVPKRRLRLWTQHEGRGESSRFSKGENVCPLGAEVTKRGRTGLRDTVSKRPPGLLPDQ